MAKIEHEIEHDAICQRAEDFFSLTGKNFIDKTYLVRFKQDCLSSCNNVDYVYIHFLQN